MPKDLLSISDLTREEILQLIDLSAELKGKRGKRHAQTPLINRSLAMIFEKPSTRTR
ncbi:MAG: ornithine carbamoyltransferase, partial [Methanosarcinales archaeon]|nr:ornithine carbamoyltransferase [Methanosarcinales archaeon]